MSVQDYIFMAAICFIQACIPYVYYHKLLGGKQDFKIGMPVYASIITLASLLMTNNVDQPYRTIINMSLMFTLVCVLFKSNFKKKLLAYTSLVLFALLGDTVSFYMISLLNIPDLFVQQIVQNSIFCVVYALLITIAYYFIKALSEAYDKNIFSAFIIIPVSQAALLILLWLIIFKTGIVSYDTTNYYYSGGFKLGIMIIIVHLFALIADVVFLKIALKTVNSLHEKERLAYLEQESKLNYEYYLDLEKNAAEMRKYRHDINNIIQTIEYMAVNEENTSNEMLEMTKQLSEEINQIGLKRYCRNNLINSILSPNEKKFDSADIKCDFSVAFPEETRFSGLDICRLLTNILDNAFNALNNVETSKKEFKLEISFDDDYVYINSLNYVNNITQSYKEKNDIDHGHGIKIINEIAEKYNGYYKNESENSTFKNFVALKM